MRRKLSLIEGTMWADGLTAVNVVTTVKIKGLITAALLDAALMKLQIRHPLLRVRVEPDEFGTLYFVTNIEIDRIPVRIVSRTGDDHWKDEAFTEAITPFINSGEPLIRVVWLKSEMISELIFTSHHCVSDGKSLVNFADETLQALGNPNADLGNYTSFSDIQELIPADIRNSRKEILKAKIIAGIARLGFMLVSVKKEVTRTKPYLIHWKINKAISAQLITRCREQGVSVNAVLCMAFLNAFTTLPGVKAHSKLYCAVDMRKFIPAVEKEMMFAFPAMIGLNMKGKKAGDLWQGAKQFKAELLEQINKTNPVNILMYSERLLHYLPKMIRYAKADQGAHDFTLSNMGHVSVKPQYNHLTVEAFYSPATVFPFGNPSTLFSTAFGGEIDFIFTSDEHFLKQQDALLLKEKALAWLAEAAVNDPVPSASYQPAI